MFRKFGTKNSDAEELPKRKNKTKYMLMACEQREGQKITAHTYEINSLNMWAIQIFGNDTNESILQA
jgi:hypothetical protein